MPLPLSVTEIAANKVKKERYLDPSSEDEVCGRRPRPTVPKLNLLKAGAIPHTTQPGSPRLQRSRARWREIRKSYPQERHIKTLDERPHVGRVGAGSHRGWSNMPWKYGDGSAAALDGKAGGEEDGGAVSAPRGGPEEDPLAHMITQEMLPNRPYTLWQDATVTRSRAEKMGSRRQRVSELRDWERRADKWWVKTEEKSRGKKPKDPVQEEEWFRRALEEERRIFGSREDLLAEMNRPVRVETDAEDHVEVATTNTKAPALEMAPTPGAVVPWTAPTPVVPWTAPTPGAVVPWGAAVPAGAVFVKPGAVVPQGAIVPPGTVVPPWAEVVPPGQFIAPGVASGVCVLELGEAESFDRRTGMLGWDEQVLAKKDFSGEDGDELLLSEQTSRRPFTSSVASSRSSSSERTSSRSSARTSSSGSAREDEEDKAVFEKTVLKKPKKKASPKRKRKPKRKARVSSSSSLLMSSSPEISSLSLESSAGGEFEKAMLRFQQKETAGSSSS